MPPIDPGTLAAYLAIIAAVSAGIVSIISAWRTPNKIIANANANAEKVASTTAATVKTVANRVHGDQSILHRKLDTVTELSRKTVTLVNGEKTALLQALETVTLERNLLRTELAHRDAENA